MRISACPCAGRSIARCRADRCPRPDRADRASSPPACRRSSPAAFISRGGAATIIGQCIEGRVKLVDVPHHVTVAPRSAATAECVAGLAIRISCHCRRSSGEWRSSASTAPDVCRPGARALSSSTVRLGATRRSTPGQSAIGAQHVAGWCGQPFTASRRTAPVTAITRVAQLAHDGLPGSRPFRSVASAQRVNSFKVEASSLEC
jgi:hypothetical protein